MTKLVDVLLEILPDIKFTKPNFEHEWGEAARYPKIFPSKDYWFKVAKQGKVINATCEMDIRNTDFCYDGSEELDPDKVARVKRIVAGKTVELPIVMKKDEIYELIGGNTRLTALEKSGLPTKVWLIDLDQVKESKLLERIDYQQIAAKIIKQYGLKSKVKFGSGNDLADYKPETDTIYLRNSYSKVKEFYMTVLHEIHHALMAKQLGAKKFMKKYIQAGTMAAHIGLDPHNDNKWEKKAEDFAARELKKLAFD
jgi:hypothetical protein